MQREQQQRYSGARPTKNVLREYMKIYGSTFLHVPGPFVACARATEREREKLPMLFVAARCIWQARCVARSIHSTRHWLIKWLKNERMLCAYAILLFTVYWPYYLRLEHHVFLIYHHVVLFRCQCQCHCQHGMSASVRFPPFTHI